MSSPQVWLSEHRARLAGATAAAVNGVIVGALAAALATVPPRHHAGCGGGWRAVARLLVRSADGGGARHG